MPLVERDEEMAVVSALLGEVSGGHGAVLLIEGAPGIGKTTLLARARSAATGFRVLTSVGGEIDQDLPFGVVRQLLEGSLRGRPSPARESLLAGAAGLAAPVFGIPGPAGNVELGLYWLCANLAAQSPLLLVIDDVHWADAASLRFLASLAKRVAELPVLLVLAGRAGPMLDDFATRALHGTQPHQLRLRPLSDAGVAAVVRQELAADADDSFCRACARATGGNPFLLTEALASLRASGVHPVAGQVGQLETLRPDTIARAILPRIARHGPDALRFARALAVLGPSVELRHVARHAGLDVGRAAQVADALAREAILTRSRPVQFVHPLVRAAVYTDASEVLRAADHKRAALLLAADSDPVAVVPAEQLVPHLLAAEADADPWVVERLREAAASALARGAPESAATCLKRALREPPAPTERGPVQAELGRALGMANRPQEAASAMRNAITLAASPMERASLALELALLMTVTGHGDAAREAARIARQAVDPDDPDLPLPMHAAFALADLTTLTPPTLWLARLDRLVPRLRPGQDTGRLIVSVVAFGAAGSGDRPAREVARLASLAATGPLPARDTWALANMANAGLGVAGRLRESIDVLDRAIDVARQRGDIAQYGYMSVLRSHSARYAGRLDDAEADGRTAVRLLGEVPGRIAELAAAVLVDALTERGELAEAQRVLGDSGLDAGEQHVDFLIVQFILMARGRLRLRQGRPRDALTDLMYCGEALTGIGFANPGFAEWRVEAASALMAVGERAEAADLAAESLRLARAFGAPRSVSLALRAAGLIEGGPNGLAMLAEAAAVLDGDPAELEHARSLVAYGAALRRAGQRAQALEELRRGLDLAVRCGARSLEQTAVDELRAAGGRPRRRRTTGVDALTPSELRVARLAADGATNREIAQALFLTQRTVEIHLTNAYRRLGITARGQLRAALDHPENP